MLRWLASKSKVEEDDLLKLWKGIFYCFWHSDKAPVQVQPATSSSPSISGCSLSIAPIEPYLPCHWRLRVAMVMVMLMLMLMLMMVMVNECPVCRRTSQSDWRRRSCSSSPGYAS